MDRTETEIGKVLQAGEGRARVEVSPSAMCAHCDMTSTCVPASSGNRIIEVDDPLGVSAGQRVHIELGSGSMVLASFLAYIVPLLGLFAGAVIGFYLFHSTSEELGGVLGAAAGLAAGLLLSRALGNRFAGRGTLTPTITAVATEKDTEENKDAN